MRIFTHLLLTASVALSSMLAVSEASTHTTDYIPVVENTHELTHIQDIADAKCSHINAAGEKHNISLRTNRSSPATSVIFTYLVDLNIAADLKRSRLMSFVKTWNRDSLSDKLSVKDNQIILEQFVAVETLHTKADLTEAFKAFTKRSQRLWYSFRDLNGC